MKCQQRLPITAPQMQINLKTQFKATVRYLRLISISAIPNVTFILVSTTCEYFPEAIGVRDRL